MFEKKNVWKRKKREGPKAKIQYQSPPGCQCQCRRCRDRGPSIYLDFSGDLLLPRVWRWARHLSGYYRRVLGDLAYLEGSIVKETTFPLEIYANCSTPSKFDPTPATGCYSSIQRSKPSRTSWQSALHAAKERPLICYANCPHGVNISEQYQRTRGHHLARSGGMGMIMSTSPSTFIPRIDSIVVPKAFAAGRRRRVSHFAVDIHP